MFFLPATMFFAPAPSVLASAPSVLSISHYAEAWVGLRIPYFQMGQDSDGDFERRPNLESVN